MALSTCIKCSGHVFEVVHNTPTSSNYKLMFIQCSSCGGVVGVLEFHNVSVLLGKLAKKLGFDLFS